jgi:hypothetical protein
VIAFFIVETIDSLGFRLHVPCACLDLPLSRRVEKKGADEEVFGGIPKEVKRMSR